MGFDSKPKTTQVNPNTPAQMGAANSASAFVQQLFGGQNPFAGVSSPLQQQAVGNIGGLLNQPNPELQTFNQLLGPMLGMINADSLQNPFGADLGAMEAANQSIASAQPIFQQNLQSAMGQLSNAAPGRFSTAFQQQGIDLSRQAMQDFNLFQDQQRQQAINQQLQGRQAGLNFLLGAGNLQQQGALGAGGLLGQLAGQAGNGAFNRNLGAAQLGGQMIESQINPYLQMLLGGMQFARPQPMDTVVQQGGGGLGGFLGGLGGMALGSFLSPVGTAAGGALGKKLFGGGEG